MLIFTPVPQIYKNVFVFFVCLFLVVFFCHLHLLFFSFLYIFLLLLSTPFMCPSIMDYIHISFHREYIRSALVAAPEIEHLPFIYPTLVFLNWSMRVDHFSHFVVLVSVTNFLELELQTSVMSATHADFHDVNIW